MEDKLWGLLRFMGSFFGHLMDGDVFEAVLVLMADALIIGFVIFAAKLVWRILKACGRKLKWWFLHKKCQHPGCGRWTFNRGEGLSADCKVGKGCCLRHKLEHMASSEPGYICPIDGNPMKKVIDEEHMNVWDFCGYCESYLLQKPELQALLSLIPTNAHATDRTPTPRVRRKAA